MNWNGFKSSTGVTILLVLAGMISLAWWLAHDPVSDFVSSEPGQDNRGEGGVVADIAIGDYFVQGAYGRENLPGKELKESWPRFRGEYFDNISRSAIRLIDRFPDEGPREMWRIELGEGHAGAAIYEGVAYLLDYSEEQRADLLSAYDLVSGEVLWTRGYRINLKRNHGMSRTVPAVNEDFVLTIGPRAHVMCVRRDNGDFVWGLNVEKEYQAEVPLWYTGQCPLIYEDQAIIAIGGTSLMVALDMESGELLWETPNEKQWKMSHSSIMPWEFGGRKMLVYSAYGGVCGVAADGPDAGQILWETTAWNHQVVAPSPVCMPDGKVYLTAGYGAGAMVLQVRPSGGGFEVEVLDEFSPKDGLACEQQTPVEFQGHYLGILPKDAGPLRNQLVCVHPDDFRQVIWSSGPDVRFGLGPFLLADDKLFVLSDDATLTIIKPSLSAYQELDSYRILEGHDAWAPIALADGYMLLRDSKTMVCLDMAASRP